MISSRMQKRLVKMAEKVVKARCYKYERSGIASCWIKLTESWGTKFTSNGFKYMREVFQNQRRGWRFKLAPFCFGFFRVIVDEVDFYGYITQVALIASSLHDGKGWKAFVNKMRPITSKAKRLIESRLNISPNDITSNTDNYGWIGKQFVITDWGFDAG